MHLSFLAKATKFSSTSSILGLYPPLDYSKFNFFFLGQLKQRKIDFLYPKSLGIT